MPGNPTDVNNNDLILPAWGNQIRDQTVQRFTSTGARDSAIPSPGRGTFCVTTDTDTLWQAVGSTTVWRVAPGTVRIADARVTTAGPTIDFSGIPNLFVHLRLECALQSDYAGAAQVAATMTFNGDAGANYQTQRLRAQGNLAPTSVENINYTGVAFSILASGGGVIGTTRSPAMFDIPDYTANTQQTCQFQTSWATAWNSGGLILEHGFGAWATAAPITRLTLAVSGSNFKVGSRATLYGLT